MKQTHELLLYENLQKVMTIEDFRIKISETNQYGIMDKLADGYDKIPSFIKLLQNLDPTGISSSIGEVLSENRAKREQAMLIDSIYYLYINFIEFQNEIKESINNNTEEFSLLTEIYFQKSKDSHEKEKIKYFSEIWRNAITNNKRTLSEKEYVFELTASLSYDQINLLKYIYEKVECDVIDGVKNIANNTKPVGVQAYATNNNREYSYALQLCSSLVGKGLLNMGAGSVMKAKPTHFLPSEYVNTLIEFLCLN